MNCIICGNAMDSVLAPATCHPGCIQFTEPYDLDPRAVALKNELIDIIRWADRNSPRAKQKMIGPSELGSLCDRRIGYRIADVQPCNLRFDPWAAIVGTAVHTWLETSVEDYMKIHVNGDWVTEQTLQIDDFVVGHSDLYHIPTATVVDYKTAGPDAMKKIHKDGPPPEYVVQVMLYGYGYIKLGRPVKTVALAFYPRAGWLKDSYVWVGNYDQSVAQNALDRLYRIAGKLISLDLPVTDHRWDQVPAVPNNYCGFCPWFNPNRTHEQGASGAGCPGS